MDAAELHGPVDGNPFLMATAFASTEVGYEAREWFLSGTARSFRAVGETGDDGRWDAEPDGAAAFTTRVVAQRPADPARFNGTVVVEWCNVTGGLDAAAVWLPAHRQLIRDGFAWIGVSAQRVGIEGGGLMPNMGLRQVDPARYERLSHPGDAYAFDIFSQAAAAAPEILAGLPIERVLATGASQSAIYLTTYVNAVAPTGSPFDGYLLVGRGGLASPLDGWYVPRVALDDGASAEERAQVPGLRGATRVRVDAAQPVLVVQSETDVLGVLQYLPARQPDNDRFRLWEVAGSAHADTYMLVAGPRDSGAVPIEELAAWQAPNDRPIGTPLDLPINNGPQFHYVLHAGFAHLDRWVRDGTPPPSADRLHVDDAEAFVLDEHGNACGGVRTPWVDVPTSVLSGLGQTGALGQLFGTARPFDAERLGTLYPGGRADYLKRFTAATDATVQQGFLLDADRGEIHALAGAMFPS